ncbi:TcpQ domain-containing protein [Achromobacter xylosoxidans]|uniref:TcpQ domain-containing protein n=1 Tax=Alcaligenes xylosoxydans xylosoxydans TaxID=85698 RepID=UPI001F05E396|nr:TcpQ domain-containing protein [Achromobacter xylosoxidans]MCH1986446.1 toxin co-regulated pilus biosynthesis Q family protein [Achromobacter xylosoxidans]MCH4588257.1 toxin co-regulated pilus biosynthesis Q family protein [Achromobacter xylosoxidans]
MTSIVVANTVSTTPALADLPPTAPAPASAPDSPTSGSKPPAAAASVSEPIPEPIPVVVKEIWRIGPDDGTVRQALARWAAKANWTFGPDQWELNFDLPIQAPAEFEAESFQEATQALSQAIAMTESPVRPCFYANRVLRMVPFTRSCNRSPAAQS